ncbi:MAG: GDP-L-fucose synthase [Flavobacteriales bacterium]|nr:GDP-L-fucose synthase [Flavobacteriales bacterium]
MVGSALKRKLEALGFNNIITFSSSEVDLRDQTAVKTLFYDERPDYVFLAAARVGGILANNSFRADFMYDNLQIQNNVIHSAYLTNVKKLLFLGSSCIYPKLSPQPMKEEYLLSGYLEHTNEPYALAKIAGLKMCEAYHAQYGCNFFSVMPTNLYGPNDNYDLKNSHVLPALIRKFHEAKETGADSVTIWGTGTPRREFLHVDDLANACLHLMEHYEDAGYINVGVGEDITILDLASLIKDIVGFDGEIIKDLDKPDGTPRKLLDVAKMKSFGWTPEISLEDGIRMTYEQFQKELVS